MTIIELFPWLLALCVALGASKLLLHLGWPSALALSLGGIVGIITFVVFVFGGRHLLVWCERIKARREEREKLNRSYHSLSSEQKYPVGKNIFYECCKCGGIISSLPSKKTHCACRNISVAVIDGQVTIRNPVEAKIFSRPK